MNNNTKARLAGLRKLAGSIRCRERQERKVTRAYRPRSREEALRLTLRHADNQRWPVGSLPIKHPFHDGKFIPNYLRPHAG